MRGKGRSSGFSAQRIFACKNKMWIETDEPGSDEPGSFSMQGTTLRKKNVIPVILSERSESKDLPADAPHSRS